MEPIKQKKAGLTLLLLVAVFTLPIIFAWFLYENPKLSPKGTTHHGYLISPPFKLSNLNIKVARVPKFNPLQVEEAQKMFDQVLPGKWLLFTLNPNQCNEACQQSLYQIRQIRLASNADQNRVVTALLSFNKPDANFNQLLKTNFPNTYSLTTDGTQFKTLVKRHIQHNYALLEGAIYIADPLCNVILVYMPGTNPELIYKDLHHLLQVSQIG